MTKVLLDVMSPCPICPDHPVRGVQVDKKDVENEERLHVFSVICGHDWFLPDDAAAKMKKSGFTAA